MTATIPADAEERFQRYLESKVEYNATIEAKGDTPWHANDIEARRKLFMRRYTRPEPPASIAALTPAEIRGNGQAR